MTNIDDRIRGALSEDDRKFLASLEEDRGMFAQIGDTFQGPLGGWAKLMFVASFFIGLATLYVAIQVFTVDTDRELILWSSGFIILIIMQGFLKEWFFSRMNMNAILREVKKLQVQVAMLGEGKDDS